MRRRREAVRLADIRTRQREKRSRAAWCKTRFSQPVFQLNGGSAALVPGSVGLAPQRHIVRVEVRTHSGIVQLREGYHRPTSARRIGSGHGRSCRPRSREERRPRDPRFRMLVVELYVPSFSPQLQLTSRARTAMQPADISSSSFGSLVQATIGSRSPASIVRG
jgi:hypothetical protein